MNADVFPIEDRDISSQLCLELSTASLVAWDGDGNQITPRRPWVGCSL